jgi:glutathione S-transferase
MIKLYGGKFSRASIVQWYLEELGVPYEFVLLDMKAGEHRQPEFLAINPMGKVPAIQDDNYTLWESGAILLYLAQKYDLNYPKTPEKQAELYQWVIFANATLLPGLFIESTREKEAINLLTPLSDRFLKETFMLGEVFSVADAAMGSALGYIPLMVKLDLSPYPGVEAYLKRIAERPAYQKAILEPRKALAQ